MSLPEGALALRDRGVVPLLARAAFALAETPSRRARMPLNASSGHNWIPSAVENGLLRAIASLRNWADLLVELIYVSLVYYRIPAAIYAALREIDVLGNSAAFKASKIYQKWQALVDLRQKRLAVVKIFDFPRYVPLKACDNLQCAIISDRTRFRRCSGCLCFYYCSQECQIIDWRVGGHQEACNAYGAHCLSRFRSSASHRSTTQDNVNLKTTGDHLLRALDVANAELVHSVARAGRSAGRLAPHVVRIADGRVTHTLLVPLRRSRAGAETD
ncbi:hypothetical protein C8J57DRAFT_1349356 [Mycena rebaudengoi]|nr:hypothetical protein C8J57DRAFT_1349356 [Mycena rebaudengoi]